MKKSIDKLGVVVTRILEIFHIVGAAILAAAAVCSLIKPEWVKNFVEVEIKECCGFDLSLYGFEVNAPAVDGKMDMTVFFLFAIGGTLIMAALALIFHHLYRIFKKSQTGAPFQKETARRMRDIGILAIAIPVIGLVMGGITRLVSGVDSVELSVDTGGIFMGIIVLCLTQFFVHGAKLEQDVDGLV